MACLRELHGNIAFIRKLQSKVAFFRELKGNEAFLSSYELVNVACINIITQYIYIIESACFAEGPHQNYL